MLRSEYDSKLVYPRYRVWIDSTSRSFFYAYPAANGDDRCYMRNNENLFNYAHPPSEQLCLLIEHAAPMNVIIDKLIEEYPDWEGQIMSAYGAYMRQQESV